MSIYKVDNWSGLQTESANVAQLWCTESVTAGDWIATHWNDTSNPGGTQGESYRIGDADEEDFDVVGVALATTAAAGMVPVQIKGIVAVANVADATDTLGTKLMISTTAGRAEAYSGTDPLVRVLGATTTTASSANVASVFLYTHPRFISI